MKKSISSSVIAASLSAMLSLTGCIDRDALNESESAESTTLRLIAALPDEGRDTRLSYHEEGKAIKTLWEEGDVLTANAVPGNEIYAYTFTLEEGAGTATGIFKCEMTDPERISSQAWTIYYPGSTIRGEQDYFAFSYKGQVQRGNGNMDHLKEYHTIRLNCTDNNITDTFKDTFIDFSREDMIEQSSCLKFNLTELPSIRPIEMSIKYSAPSGYSSNCFHKYNFLNYWWSGDFLPDSDCSDKMTLALEDFDKTESITAYMMMSNYPVTLKAGGRLEISVRSDDNFLYTCERILMSDATLDGGRLHSISGSVWKKTEISDYDGLENPEVGITVLQEATSGTGTDIIIMGDGFSKKHFEKGGRYESVMIQAYEDFFSVEPYSSLKDRFNVYYINAVSAEDHDAEPLANGAVQGTASTVFNTMFTPNSTAITGDNATAFHYAAQAIRCKGGKGGTECKDENEVTRRVATSLMIVMINVECHAGTCSISYSTASDYCMENSIAYCALSSDPDLRRLTMLHEAGGHGFGKLADEYEGERITSFNVSNWDNLIMLHGYGLHRNINEHWNEEEKADGWSVDLRDSYTDETNVYWSELLDESYGYISSEGLGLYRGGYTYANLYCRPTENSLMRDQFGKDGQFFNAISRWAIWYRLMKMTGGTYANDFKSSLNEFRAFDYGLSIEKNGVRTKSAGAEGYLPLPAPTLVKGCWSDGKFIAE